MAHIPILMDLASDLSPAQILNKTMERLGDAQHNETACKQLEVYLNNMFYGENGHVNEADRLSNTVTEYLEHRFGAAFERYDFSKNMLTPEVAAKNKIELEGREAFSHKQHIQYDTVITRLKNAMQLRERLLLMDEVDEEYQELMNDLKSIVNTANALIAMEETEGFSAGGKITVNENTKGLIDELDRLYQKVTVFKSMPLSVQDTGYVFEKALTVVGSPLSFDEMVDEELAELFRAKTAGTETVSRGGLVNMKGLIELPPEISKSKNKEKKNISYTLRGDGGSTLTITGTFDKKQGKMDVKMTPPGFDDSFRVSAKNWASFDSRDFGDTSLWDALLRTAGVNEGLAYGIGLGWPDFSGSTSTLHEFAKICAVADILMGYSQETGYADTIVINNRAESHIYVYSMGSLLQKINRHLDALVLGGYNPGNIQGEMSSLFDWTEPLGNQDYMNRIQSKLAAIQISVGSGILKLK